MKNCSACLQTLPQESFSKKQWHMKKYRRCKGCILEDREVQMETPAKDEPETKGSSQPRATGVAKLLPAEISDELMFAQPPPRDECPICLLTLPDAKDTCTRLAVEILSVLGE